MREARITNRAARIVRRNMRADALDWLLSTALCTRYPITNSGSSNSTGWPLVATTATIVPAASASI